MIETIDATEREERGWGVAAHLSALVAVAGIPFGHVIGPLVVYLINNGKRPFATEHAKASLNFQITLSIGIVLLIIALCVAWFGVIAAAVTASNGDSSNAQLPPGVMAGMFGVIALFAFGGIGSLICVIIGAVAASQGRPYRYPFAINFIK
jgi:uncharacterized Tic20 family protein